MILINFVVIRFGLDHITHAWFINISSQGFRSQMHYNFENLICPMN